MNAVTLFFTAARRGRTQSGAVHGARATNGGALSASGRRARLVAFCGIYCAV